MYNDFSGTLKFDKRKKKKGYKLTVDWDDTIYAKNILMDETEAITEITVQMMRKAVMSLLCRLYNDCVYILFVLK